MPSALLRYYAGLADSMPCEELRTGLPRGTTLVRREPAGVVAAIMTWNFPQTIAFFKIAPALAAGCVLVLKPAPETVLDSVLLAEAVQEAGIPDGVINIVPGGRDTGAYLVSHPDIDKVSFTGSTRAGRQVAATCAELLRPVTLELGGKSAAVVLDDADLAANSEQFFMASLLNNGQTCYASTRILASRSRYREVVEFCTAMAHDAVVGDALDPDTQIGPLVSRRQRERVLGYIKTGLNEGARLTTGGGRPPSLDRGWFVEPTVFADVENHRPSRRKRSSARSSRSRPTRARMRQCAWRTSRSTASPAPSGPRTWTTVPRWPAVSGPAPSGSTAICPTSPPPTEAGRPADSAPNWGPRVFTHTSKSSRSTTPDATVGMRRPARASAGDGRPPGEEASMNSTGTEGFDYVIVGAGSAGCVLADRLSRDDRVRVLLLEAGGPDTDELIHIPAALGMLFGSSTDWSYRTVEQSQPSRTFSWPRGKTLGGSSSTNVMILHPGATGTTTTAGVTSTVRKTGATTTYCRIS